jgi:2-dehydro-3-deoxyphosphooctonate aldolase (KDO 8-P synthase)
VARPARDVRALGRPLAPDELLVIAGPCIIEGEQMLLDIAGELRSVAERLGVRLVVKGSYRKANRSALGSFAGPGDEAGLRALRRVRDELGLPVLTDVHETSEVAAAAEACTVLQVPAFLSRQTALIQAAVRACPVVNIKKGQFLAPDECGRILDKARAAAPDGEVWLTERGTSFGYHDLVVDMRGFAVLRRLPATVIFDTTHALQHPGTGGDRRFARTLARAAIAAGADGLFLETHPDPRHALSDAATQLPLRGIGAFLEEMVEWKRLQARWIERPDTVAAGEWGDPGAIPGARASETPGFADGDTRRHQDMAKPDDGSRRREAPRAGDHP